MRMSDTKPMKNTMRKKSPLKFKGAKEALAKAAAARDAKGTSTTKKETATSGKTQGAFGGALGKAKALASKVKASAGKPVEGKPSGPKPSDPKPSKTISKTPTDAKSAAVKPTASKGAFAAAASKATEIVSKVTPAMQLKKRKR